MPTDPALSPELCCQHGPLDGNCARIERLSQDYERAMQEQRAARNALDEAARHTLTILDNMLDGVLTISRTGLIETFNKAACGIFGYGANEVLGRNVGMLTPEAYIGERDPHYLVGKPREMLGKRKDGTVFPISLAISKVARAGRPTFVAVVRDITESRQRDEEIKRLAFFDPLTQLPNRRLLLDRLLRAQMNSSRAEQHGALMFLDLDHFKLINDTMGHDLGDELLQQVASRLKTCVREGDTVARLGGDEFVILLEGLGQSGPESAAHAEAVAGKILGALGEPYLLRGHPYVSTPSIGIVLFRGDNQSTDDLLKKADVAMYRAKAAGRNTVRFFDPAMQATVSAQAALEHDMRRGLERREFMLLYQFQVNAQGSPIGAEALLRWNHASRGVVPPAQFIKLAEECNVGHLLGQWVLETACNQLALWADQEATAHWTLAINVSPSQFADPEFASNVAQALARSGARPDQLTLELTERLLMNDTAETQFKMNTIKALGVRFSLDDFGTGYSSLMHLQRLPLDQLKIDQSFVHALLTPKSEASVARSVVALGHSLGLTVIAEGVETAAQRNQLAALGCDAFQGYYFGRPTSAGELIAAQSEYCAAMPAGGWCETD